MAVIRNRLNQRLTLNLAGGKTIDILAKGIAKVPDGELASPYFQSLLGRGDISAVQVQQKSEARAERKTGVSAVKKNIKKDRTKNQS